MVRIIVAYFSRCFSFFTALQHVHSPLHIVRTFLRGWKRTENVHKHNSYLQIYSYHPGYAFLAFCYELSIVFFIFFISQTKKDHTPRGGKAGERRAIQLGMKSVKSFLDGSDIIDIIDMTPLVHEMKQHLDDDLDHLVTPRERVFFIFPTTKKYEQQTNKQTNKIPKVWFGFFPFALFSH